MNEKPAGSGTTLPVKRGPGHRGTDVRDAVAEMVARAAEISKEAGSKMAAAMRDVVHAAAGLSAFSIESARDLVQFMVRRGQMMPDEAERLIREVEAAVAKHGSKKSTSKAAPAKGASKPAVKKAPAQKAPAKKTAKPAAKKPAPKK